MNNIVDIEVVTDGKSKSISQKSIVRAFTDEGKVNIQTDDSVYSYRKSLSALEEDLNPTRFIRISQSEIINIYKVKHFDISLSGKINVEFENGTKTWASRSCVKAIREFLKK